MSISTLLREVRTLPGASADKLKPIACSRTVPTTPTTFTKELQFAAMARSYGSIQGMASSHDVVWLMREHCDQPISVLAHWIVDRKVVTIEWQQQTLLPLFQFQLSDMSLCEPILQVVSELSEVLNDWELALWFALPNHWLELATPVDMIEHEQPAVLLAARAERYVARG